MNSSVTKIVSVVCSTSPERKLKYKRKEINGILHSPPEYEVTCNICAHQTFTNYIKPNNAIFLIAICHAIYDIDSGHIMDS